MNNTMKQNEKNMNEKSQTVKELHEAELEQISGALPDDHHCPHWTRSIYTWGF